MPDNGYAIVPDDKEKALCNTERFCPRLAVAMIQVPFRGNYLCCELHYEEALKQMKELCRKKQKPQVDWIIKNSKKITVK